MLIAGAGGHARELLGVLSEMNQISNVYFFDDLSDDQPDRIWNNFPVIKNLVGARKILVEDERFIIGVGKPLSRFVLFEKMTSIGGKAFSIISPYARIGAFNVDLGEGVNIMTNSVITQDIQVGKGTLIHINVTIHHDCKIGMFCELSPGCHLLGRSTIEDFVSIGSGAIILPGIRIEHHAVIGAGAVVTRNVPAYATKRGVPAK